MCASHVLSVELAMAQELFRGKERTFPGQETWLKINMLVRQLAFFFWNFSFVPEDVTIE